MIQHTHRAVQETTLEHSTMKFSGFMRRSGFVLSATVLLIGISWAQELSQGKQLSAADCAAAAQYGVTPDSCEQQDESRSPMPGLPKDTTSLSPTLSVPPGVGQDQRQTVPPVNPSQRKRTEEQVRPHTEFEQIVADTVGRPVPLFGQSLFSQPPSTFAPFDHVQVPGDYVVGPEDELQIRIWGQINADLRVSVDRAGQIYIPKVGLIPVAGIRSSNLSEYLKGEVSKNFHNFNLTANVGRIRSNQIFVVGQARYPGTYTISSLSTLVNAIFASGGPAPGGSLRDVQVQRGNKTITHFDFYELLARGDKSSDVRLQTGDVVFFPPVGPLAAIVGSVNTSAIFEVKRGSTLADLIETAGGLSTVADSSKITVERAGGEKGRGVLEFPLDTQSRSLPIQDGDIVRVMSSVPRFGNAVTLRGNVVNPGRYPWKPGMRVRDLIPNAQVLLTRPYWLDRAVMVNSRSTEYPIRKAESGQNVSQESSGQGRQALTGNYQKSSVGREEGLLLNGQPGQSVPRTSTDAETLTRDLHNASPEINWSYAVIQRVDPIDLSTSLVPFDLGKAVLENDNENNIELQPDDIVTIFSQADISVPQSKRDRYVMLEGEVARPGVYKMNVGEMLRDLLKRAGGLTSQSYVYGTQLTRASARAEQQKSLDELARTLEVEVRQSLLSSSAHSSTDMESVVAEQRAQEALVAQVRSTKASGRVILVLRPDAHSIDDYPEMQLEDNDRIVIPPVTATISVVGMVYNPGSFLFNPRRRVGDYLKLAGRGRANADMRHAFVLRADGAVVPSSAVNGLFSGDRFATLHLHPGDQIVVPNKIQTGNFVRGLRDWTQITSQLALTGAALAVIH